MSTAVRLQVLTNLRLAMKDELSATCRALRKIATHNYSVHMDLLSQVFQTQPTAQASEAAPPAQEKVHHGLNAAASEWKP
jgi:hypothetical protein